MSRPSFRECLTQFARSCSDPVFLQDYFLQTGHTGKTPNGTVTFVKFHGHIYACTCRHVLRASADHTVVGEQARYPTAALVLDHTVINLSSFSSTGLSSSLHAPDTALGETEADISITCLDTTWEVLQKRKGKVVINLDEWSDPPWSRITQCIAFGYLDEHKSVTSSGVVQTPMAEIAADVASSFDSQQLHFALSSTLGEPLGYYLSGISGGPVFGLWGDDEDTAMFAPIGLVFEGSPGSKKVIATAAAFLSPNDIFIRALTLTPERFSDWLDRTPLRRQA